MENENPATVAMKATENEYLAAIAEKPMTATANREYKSTMFCMLFRDKKELLELYNAVNRTCYTDPEVLQIVTLENAVYMNMKNDLAFLIDMHLNLYEHQSSFTPNMALRDLFYVAKEYQKLVGDAGIYAVCGLFTQVHGNIRDDAGRSGNKGGR